jgi:hypothetical protein
MKYSSEKESIGKHNDTTPLIVTRLFRHQVRVVINPETRTKISTGEHILRANIERGEMAKPAAATSTTLSLSPGKSGPRPATPWSTTPASLSVHWQAPCGDLSYHCMV